MANSKEIELLIKARDLASKPLAEIGTSVSKLSDAVESLVPSSEKGEVSLAELTAVANQLKAALAGLASNSKFIEEFKRLSAEFSEAGTKLDAFRKKAEAARLELSKDTGSRGLLDAAKKAQTAFALQERTSNGLAAKLDAVRVKAAAAGLDLEKLADAERQIQTTLNVAGPAFDKITTAIDGHSEATRRAREATKALNDEQKRADAAAAARESSINAKAEAALAAHNRNLIIAKEATVALAAAEAARAARRETKVEAALAAQARNLELAKEATQRLTAAEADQARKAAALGVAYDKRLAQLRAQATLTPSVVSSTQSLGSAYSRLSTQLSRVNTALGLNQLGERRSLSYFQRLRGEVLSTITAYVGLYAAVNQIGSILDTVASKNQVQNTFDVAFGPNAANQMKFVREEADRLGFRFLELAKSYGSFGIAATSTGTSLADTQSIFSNFSSVSRAMNLSTERTALVFKALEQIMSKGRVTAEELRGQLGDQLPGVMGTFAKALNIPQARLDKLLETGKLTSGTILALGLQYKDNFAGVIERASQSPQAAIERFKTAMNDLQIQIADGGFTDAFAKLTDKIAAFFKSSDGKKFAELLTTALVGLLNTLGSLIDHLDEIKILLGVVFAGKALGFVNSYSKAIETFSASTALSARNMAALGTGSRSAAVGLNVMRASAIAAAGALTAINVAIAGFFGFEFGTYLTKTFATVRQLGVVMVGGFILAFDVIAAAFNILTGNLRLGKGFYAKFKADLEILKDQFIEAGKNAEEGFEAGQESVRKRGASRRGLQGRIDAEKLATERKKIAEASGDADLKLQQSLADKISKMRAEALKKDATNIGEYRAALMEQYQDLFREIDAFGEKTSKSAAARLRRDLLAVIDLRVAQAGQKFEVEAIKAKEGEINDLLSERNKLISNANALRKDVGESETESQIKSISDEYNDSIDTKVKSLLAEIEKLPANTRKSLRALAGDLKLVQLQLNPKVDRSETASIREEYEKLRDLTAQRTNSLQAQRTLRKAELIDQKTFEENVAGINNKYAEIVPKAGALAQAIAASTTLTQAQRDALADVNIGLSDIIENTIAIDLQAARVREMLDDWADSLASGVVAFGETLARTRSLSSAFGALRDSVRSFFASLAGDIAKAIAKAAILKALLNFSNSGKDGGLISTISGVLSSGSNHSGGMAGRGYPRAVLPEWFINAPRLHSGGIPGLKSGEVASILKDNEEVLTRDDPRHVMNGGKGGDGGPRVTEINNMIDVDSFGQALGGSPGFKQSIFNVIRANKSAFQQAMR